MKVGKAVNTKPKNWSNNNWKRFDGMKLRIQLCWFGHVNLSSM